MIAGLYLRKCVPNYRCFNIPMNTRIVLVTICLYRVQSIAIKYCCVSRPFLVEDLSISDYKYPF